MSTFSPHQRGAFSRRQPDKSTFSRTSRFRLEPVAVDLRWCDESSTRYPVSGLEAGHPPRDPDTLTAPRGLRGRQLEEVAMHKRIRRKLKKVTPQLQAFTIDQLLSRGRSSARSNRCTISLNVVGLSWSNRAAFR